MYIPSEIFDQYFEVCDEFINSAFGVNCTIYYPSKQIACTNCSSSTIGNKSGNVYKSGGFAPFNMNCAYCGGNGYKESEETENIKLRVYHNLKDFIKVANVDIPEGTIQVIGFLSDLPNFLKANYLVVNSDLENYRNFKFVRSGEPFPHGFKDRYFIAFLTRA